LHAVLVLKKTPDQHGFSNLLYDQGEIHTHVLMGEKETDQQSGDSKKKEGGRGAGQNS